MSLDNSDSSPPICDYEGSDYQATFWDQGDRTYEDRVEEVALKRLLPPAGDLLLEVGAGAGRNTPRHQGFHRIVLLDYSRTQLLQAQKRLGPNPNYLYIAGDTYQLPFVSGLFEALTMIRVLHHMAEPERVLIELRRTLQPQGTLILEYANKLNLKSILRYWAGRQDWSPFTLEPVEFAALNFDFHPAAIRSWLQAAGFRLERQLTVSHFRIGFLKRRIPTSWLVAADSLAQWTGGFWQLTPSVFTRSKAVGEKPTPDPRTFFQCPTCRTPLPDIPDPFRVTPEEGTRFPCSECGRSWGYQDGIYNFKKSVEGTQNP
jgi:ubiquinone/menaquinone biosynthesis C-methylase UbiE